MLLSHRKMSTTLRISRSCSSEQHSCFLGCVDALHVFCCASFVRGGGGMWIIPSLTGCVHVCAPVLQNAVITAVRLTHDLPTFTLSGVSIPDLMVLCVILVVIFGCCLDRWASSTRYALTDVVCFAFVWLSTVLTLCFLYSSSQAKASK